MMTHLKTVSNQRKKRNIKNESYLKYLKFSLIVYLLFTCGNIHSQGNLPSSVANQYAENRDQSISDDFSTIDFNKWCYRRDMDNGIGEGTKYVYTVNNSYLSLKGDNATKKGGGLSALKSSYFGFYEFKYRVIGLKPGVDSPWHPSIWGDKNNSGKIWKALTPQPIDKIEIDMIEFYNEPSQWNSHAIAKSDGLRSKSGKLVRGSSDFDNNWHIMGFEYHPNYLQLWEKKNGSWEKVGRKVTFTDGETTNTTVNKKNRKPIFNILSNKYHVAEVDANKNSWLHIDYFYYFPYSSGNGSGGGNPIVTLRKGNATNYAIVKSNKELKNSTSPGLYAFPNPTSGIVKINTDHNLNMIPTQVNVYSFVGSLVSSYENTDTIDLSSLAEGNYFLVINLEDITTKTKKKQIIKVLKK